MVRGIRNVVIQRLPTGTNGREAVGIPLRQSCKAYQQEEKHHQIPLSVW
jgi:hypothetical protein